MRKIIKFILVFVFVLAAILISLVQTIDRTPFTQTEHFKRWQEEKENIHWSLDSGEVYMNWALENITPQESVPLAGYGKRRGKHFEGVHDSIYVRSIALKQNHELVFLVSADLLFIPPKVVSELKGLLEKDGMGLNQIHFAATHSHSSIGGWESTLTGELFGGKYNPKIVTMIAQKMHQAILNSCQNLEAGKVFYGEVNDNDDIRYRIKVENGVKDTEIRALTFEKNTGEKAHLVTYAAHSTVLSDKNLALSRDYSGVLVDSIQPDFGMYMAGAVASMGPIERGDTEFDEVLNQGNSVYQYFKKRNLSPVNVKIESALIKLPLPEPTARLTQNLALRPWVFKKFFGDYEAFIKVTQIGSTLILGMPADFSGEINVELDAYAKARGLDLIVTSFNGAYIGYITPDKIYDSGIYETVTMSWYGYQSGGYLTQVAKDIIDKIHK